MLAPRRDQDHPRGCGENQLGQLRFDTSIGSPPRMRGKRGRRVQKNAGGRITPADAGKTKTRHLFDNNPKDHPRGCGENTAGFMSSAFASRITPADAGKTTAPSLRLTQGQDHPRGCGENSDITSQRSYKSGSPPRMRGKPETDTNTGGY